MVPQNSWSEWQNHVLAELKRQSRSIDDLRDIVHEHREASAREIAALKVKASFWGGIAGSIPVVVAIIWYFG